jgi:hypothetical protein
VRNVTLAGESASLTETTSLVFPPSEAVSESRGKPFIG